MGEVKKGVGLLTGKKSSKNQDKKNGRLFSKVCEEASREIKEIDESCNNR